jgi:asparagine synthetase B (glutamine-hydrolysing)
MYAFAIWDPRSEELLLVRDRMGVKPLYYYPTGDGVLFGSEPKAILAHPDVEAVVDADGLREIFSIVKTPEHAVFRGMYEVRPGSMVRISRESPTPLAGGPFRAENASAAPLAPPAPIFGSGADQGPVLAARDSGAHR